MKNISFLLFILFISFNITAQETKIDSIPDKIKKHEVKLNAFNIIIFKSLDFSYEYLLNSESSVGISIFVNLQDDNPDFIEDGPIYNEEFAITPYYRHFFSSKYAWGFFMEAFTMYNQQKNSVFSSDSSRYTYKTSNNLAFGMSLGGKFVSKKGFLFEFYGGVGRNLITSNDNVATEFVPRFGASLGYRF